MEPREPPTGTLRHDGETAPSTVARRVERILAAVRFAAEEFLISPTMSSRICSILEALGEAANVSRVYVFENQLSSDGDLVTSQRFEWVQRGIKPQLDNPLMQRMSFERVGLEPWARALSRGRLYEAQLDNFTEAEERYASPQAIQSLLLVPLRVQEEWWGFIGFDDCITPREWSASERDALKAAGGILSAAILGWRARDEKQRLLDEQLELTQAAWRRAAEWETVLASIVDGVWVLDREERVTFANEGARRLFGVASAEEMLRPCKDYLELAEILDMAERPIPVEEFPPCRALRGEEVNNLGMQLVSRASRSRRFVRMSSAPILDESGEVVGGVAVATDVTEGVEFDRLKDQFIRVAAHELKTPVAIMKGYAQLALRTGAAESPTQLERLRAIDRGADRIDRIIQDLLGVSQIYAEGFRLDTKRIDLHELAVGLIGEAARGAPERPIDFVATGPAPMLADPERIAFVLRSLIDNALRYSPEGSPIEIRMDSSHDGNGGARPQGVVTVAVADRGVGIPAVQQKHVFEPFFRAHTDTPHDHGGMGVGLFTSREIIRQHGGTIWFESAEGAGSTFYFQLPLGGDDERRTQGADRR